MKCKNNDKTRELMKLYIAHCEFLKRIASEISDSSEIDINDLTLIRDGAETLRRYGIHALDASDEAEE